MATASSKEVGIPLPWSTDKISVPDTLTPSWRLLGTRYRHPRLQFWNDNGLDPVKPGELRNELDAPEDESRERIHATVRFLTEEEAFLQYTLQTRFVEVSGFTESRM